MSDQEWQSFCLVCGGTPEDGGLQDAAAKVGMRWVHERCADVFAQQMSKEGQQLIPMQLTKIDGEEQEDLLPTDEIEKYAKRTTCPRCGKTGTLRGNLISDEGTGASMHMVSCTECPYSVTTMRRVKGGEQPEEAQG